MKSNLGALGWMGFIITWRVNTITELLNVCNNWQYGRYDTFTPGSLAEGVFT